MERTREGHVTYSKQTNSLEWPPFRKAVSNSKDKNKSLVKNGVYNRGTSGENIYKGVINLSEIGRQTSGNTNNEHSASALTKNAGIKSDIDCLKPDARNDFAEIFETSDLTAFTCESDTDDPHYDNISQDDLTIENNSPCTKSSGAPGFSFVCTATDRILTKRDKFKRQHLLDMNQFADVQHFHKPYRTVSDTTSSSVIPRITITNGTNRPGSSNYRADARNENRCESPSHKDHMPLSYTSAEMCFSFADVNDEDSSSEKMRRASAPAMQDGSPQLLNISPAFHRRIFKSISTDGLGGNDLAWRSTNWENLPEYQRSWSDDFYELILQTHSHDPAKAEYFRKLIDERYEALFSKRYPGLKLGSQRRRDEGNFRRTPGLDGPQSPRTVKRRAAATRQKRISRDSSPTHSQQSLPDTLTSSEDKKVWSLLSSKESMESLHVPDQSHFRFSSDKSIPLGPNEEVDAPRPATTQFSASKIPSHGRHIYSRCGFKSSDNVSEKSFHGSNDHVLDKLPVGRERPCLADGTDGADSDDNHSKTQSMANRIVKSLSDWPETADTFANRTIVELASLSPPQKSKNSNVKVENWDSSSNEYASIQNFKRELKQNNEKEDSSLSYHPPRMCLYSEVRGQSMNIKTNSRDCDKPNQNTGCLPLDDDTTWLRFSSTKTELVTPPEPIYESIISIKAENSRENGTGSSRQIGRERGDDEKYEHGNVYDDIQDLHRQQKMGSATGQDSLSSAHVYLPETPPSRFTQDNLYSLRQAYDSSGKSLKVNQAQFNLRSNERNSKNDEAVAIKLQPSLGQPRPKPRGIPDSVSYKANLPTKPEPVFASKTAKKGPQQISTQPYLKAQSDVGRSIEDSPKLAPLKKPRTFFRDANSTQPTVSLETETKACLNNIRVSSSSKDTPNSNKLRVHSMPNHTPLDSPDDSTLNCFRSTGSNIQLEHSSTDDESLDNDCSLAGCTNSSGKQRSRSAGEDKDNFITETYANSSRKQQKKILYFNLNNNILDSLQKSSV